jgi:hypothetical protein
MYKFLFAILWSHKNFKRKVHPEAPEGYNNKHIDSN